MTAKQTVKAASLVVLLAASPAAADADADAPQSTGDVHLDVPASSGEDAAPTPIEAGTADAPPGAAPGATPPAPVEPAPPRPPTGRFEIGAGFSSDEHFIASATIAQDDLFRTGTALSLTARISARRQLFLTRVEDPSVLGTSYRLRGDLYNERKQFLGFTREVTGVALTLARPITPHLHAFLGYRLEEISVEPGDGVLARGVPGAPELRGGRLAALRTGIAYSTLDTPWLPTRGTSVGASIEIADRTVGSQIEMFRTDAWLSHHRPLGPFTLHLGATLATVSSGAPISERLHLEGSSELRGYAPGALGPTDALTGMSLGGNLKYTARGELEVPLIPRIGLSAAAFVDAAGIHGSTGGGAGASAGFGLIWRSPIGPLRFDWAVPLDGGRPSFVFGLGGSF